MTNINTKAPVTCSKTISINANPERVWTAMTSIDQWANWQTDISKPKLKGELIPGGTFDWKSGGVTIHSILHTVDPTRILGWTGKTFGMFAIHNWTFRNLDGQTQVRVDESMEGFLARIFKGPLNKSLDKSLEKWLDLLKKECEKPVTH